MTCVIAATPAMRMQLIVPSRGATAPTNSAPSSWASSPSRSEAARSSQPASAVRSASAAANPAMPGRFSVPAR